MGTRRQIRDIDLIVIHCSATQNGRWITVNDIDTWHKARRFNRDMSIAPDHEPRLWHIGYHHVIYTTGAVCCGRPLRESGAHAAGHNAKSIGVCLVGTDSYSRLQWDALAKNICLLAATISRARAISILRAPLLKREALTLLAQAVRVVGHRISAGPRRGRHVEPRSG